MNAEKALQIIKNEIYASGAEKAEAMRLIEEAVGKQVAQKPKGEYDSVPHFRCPCCNSTVVLYCDSAKHPHCKYCGQKLDWSDEE